MVQKSETGWFVGYTMPKSEKKLKEKLDKQGVENYLPLNKTVRQWSDRKKIVEEPLFPNYIFIRINPKERFNVLIHKEMVRFVEFCGKPAIVKDEEVTGLQKILSRQPGGVNLACASCWNIGSKVVIQHGPFAGYKGVVIKKGNSREMIIQMEGIQQFISVRIDGANLHQYIH